MSGPGIIDVPSSINALDSKLRLVAQRIKIIENNEQIIGRTLVSHNKKMKELSDVVEALKAVGVKGGATASSDKMKSEIITELAARLPTVSGAGESADVMKQLLRMREELDATRKLLDKVRSDISEMKYVVDSINPVAYVTVDQVREIIDEKLEKRMERSKEKDKKR
jgi:hypothetical protein